jgi:hypothetical protein
MQSLRFLITFLVIAGLNCAAVCAQTASQRGVQDITAVQALSPVGPYYALVIGNNDYQHVDKLQTAMNDAREVSQVLRDRFGFHTQVLYNATRAQTLRAIDSYRTLPADSNLLFYYAGHGHRDKDANRAYWLPVDADRNERANWINSTDITDGIHAIKSRHILLISDSCFSGDLVLRATKAAIVSGGYNAIIAKALRQNSRHIMSSGGDEPVADSGTGDHSVFAAALLESLNDMPDDVFRGNDLFDKAKLRVEMRSQANQTPRYEILRDSAADLGDFVFFRAKNTLAELLKDYRPRKQGTQGLELLSVDPWLNARRGEIVRRARTVYIDGLFSDVNKTELEIALRSSSHFNSLNLELVEADKPDLMILYNQGIFTTDPEFTLTMYVSGQLFDKYDVGHKSDWRKPMTLRKQDDVSKVASVIVRHLQELRAVPWP